MIQMMTEGQSIRNRSFIKKTARKSQFKSYI